MKAGSLLRGAVSGAVLLCIGRWYQVMPAWGSQPQCTAVETSLSLKTGEQFAQPIGALTLKLQPFKAPGGGWAFSFEDAKGRDYIYPVNPALRFNASQMLGAGYGLAAKESLRRDRTLRFLLRESDYDSFLPYVDWALWPYTAPEPDLAAENYLAQLDKLRTGLLHLTVVHAEVSEEDEVRSADLRAEFTAPAEFFVHSSLPSRVTACPPDTLPINERLPARIPLANPRLYLGIRDAALWRNPLLTITEEGFELRFRDGQSFAPLTTLARTVVALSESAWPYGRVIAATETSVRATGSGEQIKKNREAAGEILKGLGLIVDWWPTA